eukprot:10287776-Ditylum_brightwellii.AAC.1
MPDPAQFPPSLPPIMLFLPITSLVQTPNNTITDVLTPNAPLCPSQPDPIGSIQGPTDEPTNKKH